MLYAAVIPPDYCPAHDYRHHATSRMVTFELRLLARTHRCPRCLSCYALLRFTMPLLRCCCRLRHAAADVAAFSVISLLPCQLCRCLSAIIYFLMLRRCRQRMPRYMLPVDMLPLIALWRDVLLLPCLRAPPRYSELFLRFLRLITL